MLKRLPGRVPAGQLSMLLVAGVAMQCVRDHSSVARVPALDVRYARLSCVAERHASAYHLQECSVAFLAMVFLFELVHRTAQEGHDAI